MLDLIIVIIMKKKINMKNVMINVQLVQEKEMIQIIIVLNVLQVITLFIIKLECVSKTNQAIVIMMKKKICIKNAIVLAEHVTEPVQKAIIIVKLV